MGNRKKKKKKTKTKKKLFEKSNKIDKSLARLAKKLENA